MGWVSEVKREGGRGGEGVIGVWCVGTFVCLPGGYDDSVGSETICYFFDARCDVSFFFEVKKSFGSECCCELLLRFAAIDHDWSHSHCPV